MAEPSSDLGHQLKPLSFDLALVRRSLEQLAADQKQLAAKQEEIAHDVATLQAVERDLRQNISSGPPPGTLQILRHKPAQPPAQSLAVQ
jgi:chromosome segregation ATPase